MATETTVEKRDEGEVARTEYTRTGRYYRPNVDILEDADELTVLVDIPGVKADDVDIQFEAGALAISGRVGDRQPQGTQYLLQEYGIGDFHRCFQVSEVIDAGRISAECGDGVLTVHLPKVEAAKPRKIAVQSR
jgi:HSP20 family protein